MPTLLKSENKFDTLENIIFSEKLKIANLDFHPEQDLMLIILNTGLVLRAKLSSFTSLKKSNKTQLRKYELVANGTGVHWESLDEDLSLKGLLRDHMINILKSNYVVG